jgi:hypothetical protein
MGNPLTPEPTGGVCRGVRRRGHGAAVAAVAAAALPTTPPATCQPLCRRRRRQVQPCQELRRRGPPAKCKGRSLLRKLAACPCAWRILLFVAAAGQRNMSKDSNDCNLCCLQILTTCCAASATSSGTPATPPAASAPAQRRLRRQQGGCAMSVVDASQGCPWLVPSIESRATQLTS